MSRITVSKEGQRWIARFAFDVATKDVVKAAGFRFDGDTKRWYTTDPTVAGKLSADAADHANRSIEASRAVDAAVSVPAPEGLAYLSYQLAGIAYASTRPGTLIADEMGLGKTIEAIGVVNADSLIGTVLVVCPASVKINWARELKKWLVRPMSVEIANGTFPQADIVIVNFEQLGKHRPAIDARQWDMLVVDECHRVKNPKAQRTQLLLGHQDWKNPQNNLPGIAARRRLFLTGTPIVNRPKELWTLVQVLDPNDMGRNFLYFMKRYAAAHQTKYGWDFDGASNLDELQTRLRAKCMIRRLKADVLKELPAKRRQIIVLPEDDEAAVVLQAERAATAQMQARIEQLREAVAKAQAAGDRAAYERAVRELKDATDFRFSEMARLARLTAEAKVPQVIAYLTDCLENEGKIVVFCHHLSVAQALQAAFPKAAVVTGEVPLTKRQQEVDRFQEDKNCRLFIGGITAAGVGLTLTAADHVVFVEEDWVPGNITQAEDRCHRIGQHNSVLVQHLIYDDSIDSRRAQMIVDKQAVIDRALDDPTGKVAVSDAVKTHQAEAAKPAKPMSRFEIPDDATVPF